MRVMLFASALLSLLLVACGGDGGDNNTADQCVGTQTTCLGDMVMWCNTGSWAEGQNCASTNKVCQLKDGSAQCISLLCGNGAVDLGEACDGDAKECTQLSNNYIGGYASCKSDCLGYDVSACVAEPYCGDGIVNNSETCDKDSKNCTQISADYSGGSAICKSDCSGYDTTTCSAAPYCGDGIINGTEKCDGNYKDCEDILDTSYGGSAPCYSNCSGYDTSIYCSKKTSVNPEISVTDRCDDDLNIRWRIFDIDDSLVWPGNGASDYYTTEGYDEESIKLISCYSGNMICVGGARYPDDGTTWCVGFDAQVTSKYGDSKCCISCHDDAELTQSDLEVGFSCN